MSHNEFDGAMFDGGGIVPTQYDRASWPAGPWDGEPDEEEFEAYGLKCELARGYLFGNWCGYVTASFDNPIVMNPFPVINEDTFGYEITASHRNEDGSVTLGFACLGIRELGPQIVAELRALKDGEPAETEKFQVYRTIDEVRALTTELARIVSEGEPR